MRTKQTLFLLTIIFLVGCSSPTSPNDDKTNTENTTTEDTSQQSEEVEKTEEVKEESVSEITIVSSSAKVETSSIGTNWIYIISEIKNTGTTTQYLSSGTVDIESEDGKLLETISMVSCYPEVILPGESAFYYEATTVDRIEPDDVIKPILHYKAKDATVEQLLLPTSDVEIHEGSYGGLEAIGRVENTTDEEQSLIYVALLIRDKEGNPLCVLFDIPDTINPGEKMGFKATALSLPEGITLDSIGDYEIYAYISQFQF